jgi:hypothetical protein
MTEWLERWGIAGLILILVVVSKISWHLAKVALKLWIRWS